MSKEAYIGINNVAHKIKKGYIGIDGVARKIKKAYIGIGGVARPCWSGGELVYYGTIENLGVATPGLAATHVGDHALFGGGEKTSMVYAYGTNLTRIVPNDLSHSRSGLAATHVGDYAIFGGGAKSNGKATEAYNKYLTKIEATQFTQLTGTGVGYYRSGLVATHTGGRAIFAGGMYSTSVYNYVDIYDHSLTKITSALGVGRWSLAATHVGDYALFGGGFTEDDTSDPTSVVEAYNSSFTRISSVSPLEIQAGQLTSAHVGNYALFCGGLYYSMGTGYNNVTAYDVNLVKTTPTKLSVGRYLSAGTHVGDYALFGGGFFDTHGGIYCTDTVEVYDSSLTRTDINSLSERKYSLAATHIGNHALFGGGRRVGSIYCSSVDAYAVV